MKSLLVILLVLLDAGCAFIDSTDAGDALPDDEYIIQISPGDGFFYAAVNLRTRVSTPIFAVRELSGYYYTPASSRFPEFNRMIIQGYFDDQVVDDIVGKRRIFVVTKLVGKTNDPRARL